MQTWKARHSAGAIYMADARASSVIMGARVAKKIMSEGFERAQRRCRRVESATGGAVRSFVLKSARSLAWGNNRAFIEC